MAHAAFQDADPNKINTSNGYASIYRDVRAAVDLCHRQVKNDISTWQAPVTLVKSDMAHAFGLEELQRRRTDSEWSWR